MSTGIDQFNTGIDREVPATIPAVSQLSHALSELALGLAVSSQRHLPDNPLPTWRIQVIRKKGEYQSIEEKRAAGPKKLAAEVQMKIPE